MRAIIPEVRQRADLDAQSSQAESIVALQKCLGVLRTEIAERFEALETSAGPGDALSAAPPHGLAADVSELSAMVKALGVSGK